MKKILTSVFILFNSITVYCQHPYRQDLQSEAQIIFPDTPKIEFDDGATYYSRDADSCIYFAQVIDLTKIDPNSINPHQLDDIYNQFIRSAINPLKGVVFYHEKIEINGLKGVAFNYKCSLKGNVYYAYQQVFQVKQSLMSYSLLSPDSLSTEDKNIKSFFGTFKLTPLKAAQINKNSSVMAGIYMTSALLFWSSVIFYAVKRNRKKKKYEWPEGL